MYKILMTKRSRKDQLLLKNIGLDEKTKRLIKILEHDPFQCPPAYEKLLGQLDGFYSRRINIQHRLVYQVLTNENYFQDDNGEKYEGCVKIIRMWTHYEGI